MRLFKPTISLLHKSDGNGCSEYDLHVVTWFDHSGIEADGLLEPMPQFPDSNGTYLVRLKVIRGTEPGMAVLSPVVHKLSLGRLPLSDSAPFVKVEVINPEAQTPLVGHGLVHHMQADEDSKPLLG